MPDLQEKLAAACERHGVEAQEPCCVNCGKGRGVEWNEHRKRTVCKACLSRGIRNVPLPIPELTAGLEGWLDKQGLSLLVRRNHWQPHGPWAAAWAVHADRINWNGVPIYVAEQTARGQAALAAERKVETDGKG